MKACFAPVTPVLLLAFTLSLACSSGRSDQGESAPPEPDNPLPEDSIRRPAAATLNLLARGDTVPEPDCREPACMDRLTSRSGIIRFLPDGEIRDRGLLLYPGAFVDPLAYARIARQVVSAGFPVVIAGFPDYLPLNDTGAADAARAALPEVRHWVLAGHSMGGVAAARAVAADPDLQDLILWASWPDQDLSGTDLRILSLFASEDAGAGPAAIDRTRKWLPADAVTTMIYGGNHAGFGDYGPQERDGRASISPDRQLRLVSAATIHFLRHGHPDPLPRTEPDAGRWRLARQLQDSLCARAQVFIAGVTGGTPVHDTLHRSYQEFVSAKPEHAADGIRTHSWIGQRPGGTGMPPLLAETVFCKMQSRAELQNHGSLPLQDTDEKTCRAMNRRTMATIQAMFPPEEQAILEASSPIFADDLVQGAGPEWLEAAGGYPVEGVVTAPRLVSGQDVPARFRGKFYCRLWSPADALRLATEILVAP